MKQLAAVGFLGWLGAVGAAESSVVDDVDVFIGTSGSGHAFPAASFPFGMVQAGPDTGTGSWDYCGGYRYEDGTLLGFSQTHLCGTGRGEFGDVLMLPFAGGTVVRKAKLDHRLEKASPGHYSIRLDDAGAEVEIAAAPHSAIYRIQYLRGNAKLLLDLQHGITSVAAFVNTHVQSNRVEFAADGMSLAGTTTVRKNFPERSCSYSVAFSRPVQSVEELPRGEGEKASRYVLDFGLPQGGELYVKIGLSANSPEAAADNLRREIPGWDFELIRRDARRAWEARLSSLRIKGTREDRRRFYSCLYRAMLQPNNIADVGGTCYSTLSLWDTYRAAHPLYTLVAPDIVEDVVESMLRHRERYGYLPVWSIWGKDSHAMVGNHAVPVILDAWRKGFRFDRERAYRAVRESLLTEHATHPKDDWGVYDRHGYYPRDVIRRESVSRTLECAYDDWCAAEMAKMLGKADDEKLFRRRAGYWKNVFDPETGFARGRESDGSWRRDFDPLFAGWGDGVDFVEGNSWQWTWHVMHDPEGLVAAMGGKEKFVAKLDRLFSSANRSDNLMRDVTGLIGQYAHGNEPSHHVAYFYRFADRGDRTAEIVAEICGKFYGNRPDGLSGNEDCGQMSAWYLFSAMGFYPFNPASAEYVLGAPQLPEVDIALPDGKRFRIVAKNLSKTNKYVRSVKLNGRTLEGFKLKHSDIVNGGELVFEMGGKPPAFIRAKPVWTKEFENEVNRSATFSADVPRLSGEAKLRIAGASYFSAKANGELVGFGPARAPAGHFRVDEFPLRNLTNAANRIEITVAGYNCDSFCISEEKPFLQAEIVDGDRVAAHTGEGGGFAAAASPRIQKVNRYSACRFFCEAYRLPSAAAPLRQTELAPRPLLPRRVAYPDLSQRLEFKPAGVQRLRYNPDKTLKRRRHIDRVALTGVDGKQYQQTGFPMEDLELNLSDEAQRWELADGGGVRSVLYDLGVNRTGFADLKVKCAAPCKIMVTFDETLIGGTVNPVRMDAANVFFWEIGAAGEYALESFEPYTMRYLRCWTVAGEAEFLGAGLRLFENGDARIDAPDVADPQLLAIYEAAYSTFSQNAADCFTDCPSRERAAWLCDSFFIARAAEYFTGDLEMENLFFENYLLPESFPDIPDGMLPRLYPGDDRRGIYISNWAMWFVLQLEEFAERGGDSAIVNGLKPKVLKFLDWLARYENADGLLERLPGWVFVEWSKANELVQDVNYPSNMLYAKTLRCAAKLYGRKDLDAKADRLAEQIVRHSYTGKWFRDRSLRDDATGRLVPGEECTETCQYYAFFLGIADPQRFPELWKRLVDEFGAGRDAAKTHPEIAPSTAFIGNLLRLDLLMRHGEREKLASEIKRYYSGMAAKTGTLWELDRPTASACHGFAGYVGAIIGNGLRKK